jgi:membrane protein YqaA with SNARE-associated domain
MEGKSTMVTVITVIGALVVPLAALAVAYGLLTQDEAELWVALIVALLGALGSVAPVLIGRNYNDNRAAVVTEAMRTGNTESIQRF